MSRCAREGFAVTAVLAVLALGACDRLGLGVTKIGDLVALPDKHMCACAAKWPT